MPLTYTWDLNTGLPVVLQDGASTYVYGLGLISQTDANGNQTYPLGDGLGSATALLDASGNVTATYQYDVFGASRGYSGTTTTDFRFTGQQVDGFGYNYLRARYYEPSTGRFLSKDPFPGVQTLPASQHPYAYVHNNPANYTDPTGEVAWFAVLAAVWAAYEIGSSVYDAYSTASTLLDPCASTEEKLLSSGLFLAGLVGPGGGYSTGGRVIRNVGGGQATVDTALRNAERWLGPGYREIAPGVYHSADNTRQFRMTDSDLLDPRQGAHVHFEAVGSDGREIVQNSHVTLIDP